MQFGDEHPFRFLIHDRDTRFSRAFDEVFRAEGIKLIGTPVQAPNAKAFAERWIRTVRPDCFDRILILAHRHLEHLLRVYPAATTTSQATPRSPTAPAERARADAADSLEITRVACGGIAIRVAQTCHVLARDGPWTLERCAPGRTEPADRPPNVTGALPVAPPNRNRNRVSCLPSNPAPGSQQPTGGTMNKRSDVQAKGRMTRRLLAVLALAMIGIVASATAAQAQVTTNEQVPLAFAGFVPCANGGAGEILSGTIEVHNLITSTVNDNNTSDKFQFQPHGTMVGAITGDVYRVTGVSQGTSTESLQNGHYTLTS